MEKFLYIMFSVSSVIIEIISYFIIKPKDLESFIFIWLLISILLLVYSLMRPSKIGLGRSISRFNATIEAEKMIRGENKKKSNAILDKSLYTLIKILLILTNLILYIIIVIDKY